VKESDSFPLIDEQHYFFNETLMKIGFTLKTAKKNVICKFQDSRNVFKQLGT